jgi:hypothetical protein
LRELIASLYLRTGFFIHTMYSAFIRKIIFYFSSFLFLLFGCSCNNQPADNITAEPSFYHWKSVFAPSAPELKMLKEQHVQTLYLHFFDVSWNADIGEPSPIAQLRIPDSSIFARESLGVIPTVFITNECIQKIRIEQCEPLAGKILSLINGIIKINGIQPVAEVQIDCDWTASTKEKYFLLLQALQKKDSIRLYSATIRLFQVKYANTTGVPPVKKGLLMCYNMGNVKNPAVNNSILDPGELKKYINGLDKYPLPLDVAFPLFNWYVLFRNNVYTGLLRDLPEDELNKICSRQQNRFTLLADTNWRGVDLKKGDVLRYENSSYADIMAAAALVKEKLGNRKLRLSLYHLDSLILKKYTSNEIENIFGSLR